MMSAESPRLCLFCGARTGHDPAYALLAAELGVRLAKAGVELVYGGGALGLMGITARAARDAGGRVIGIIPHYLATVEIAQTGLSELIVVDTLLERKRLMAERSDAFLALPGGIGTLDELLEMMTWSDLGEHQKPTYLLAPDDYWQPFHTLFSHIVSRGFASEQVKALAVELPSIEALLATLGVEQMAL